MNDVKRINLDDYIQTGEGATALTYTSKDGKTLAKLYNLGFEADRAKEEFLTAQIVFEMGIPTPTAHRGSQPSDSPVRCHQGAFYAYYR